jgi:(p)ppGpp synthase/HD superfamily hydrolase
MELDLMDHMLISKARKLAEHAHSGQLDKAGAPYLGHVRRVVDRVDGGVEKAVAWLHDVLEDTSFGELDLMRAGMPKEVIAAVLAITHRPHEPRVDYYARVKADRYALVVKLADVADNSDPARLAQLDDATRDRLVAKYAKARAILED